MRKLFLAFGATLLGGLVLIGVILLIMSFTVEPQHQQVALNSGNTSQVVYVHDNSYNDFFMWMWLMDMHTGMYGYWHPYMYQRTYVINHYGYSPGRYYSPARYRSRGCSLVLNDLQLVGAKSGGSSSFSSRPAPPPAYRPSYSKPSTSRPSTSRSTSKSSSRPSTTTKSHC